MIFEYKTTSATSLVSGTNTAMGAVIMATSYNAINPTFTSKAQMENYEFASSCVPSNSMIHPIECARGETPLVALYTRGNNSQEGVLGGDLRLYDLGNFVIATQGMQSANIIGELWVSFDVELLKPKLNDALNNDIAYDHWIQPVAGASSTSVFLVGQGQTNAATLTKNSTLGSNIFVNNVLTLPSTAIDRYYQIQYIATGSSTTLTNALVETLSANVQVVNVYQDGSFSKVGPSAGSTLQFQFVLFYVFCPATIVPAANQITFSAGTLPGSLSGVDLIVTEVTPSIGVFP